LVLEIVVSVAVLILGIILMTYSSDKAVKHAVHFASAIGISPFLVGLIVVSLGTDFPEIINSIISSSMGHGNLNVGDSLGSILTQFTLVLGLLLLIGGSLKVKKREVVASGMCLLLSLIVVFSTLEKGYVTRLNAFFLIGSWPMYLVLIHFLIRDNSNDEVNLDHPGKNHFHYAIVAIVGFIGVAIGSYMVIQAIISMSNMFGVPELILGFFLASIGTSLPELVVTLTAIRRKQYEVSIGNIIGSCIVDATVSIGIGLLLFPQTISADLSSITALITMGTSAVVILLLSLRERVDRKIGGFFIALYLLAFLIVRTLLL
jgi:cation:H+ antiporter